MSRILIADDEPHIRKLVSFTLSNRGHEIIQAEDGGQALEMARAEQPDLILLDVMMPVMTGYDVLDRLKADEGTAAIPVIMLSAKSQRTEVEEGLTRGAEQYICKPFTPKDLVQQVNELLDT
ncbi:MAG: response regulator [Coriobacteriia bacterium]|nr:response regulator [Coriobacteriia bacterium]MBN2847313.1 response regulator [Coriobacteriia bacterium]